MILTYLRAARQVLITETYIGGWFLIVVLFFLLASNAMVK